MNDLSAAPIAAWTPDEEAQIRRRVRAYREADWGDYPDWEYHPERICQADEDASRLLATLDAARSTSEPPLVHCPGCDGSHAGHWEWIWDAAALRPEDDR